MKKKVQAQRKFAQGAFIPPNNNNAADRRHDINTAKEDSTVVINNNMTARNLLDVVSFQNMHSHMQPVVLLERLQGTPTSENPDHNEPASPLPCSNIKGFRESSSTSHVDRDSVSLISTVGYKKISQTSNDNDGMRLRSTATKACIVPKPKRSKRKRCVKAKRAEAIRKSVKKKVTDVIDFTVEDNRPLKYLVKSTRSTTNNPKGQKLCPSKPDSLSLEWETVTVEPGIQPFSNSRNSTRPQPDSNVTLGCRSSNIRSVRDREWDTYDSDMQSAEGTSRAAIGKTHPSCTDVAYKNKQVERWLSESVAEESRRLSDNRTFKVPHPMPRNERRETELCSIDGLSRSASVVLEEIPVETSHADLEPRPPSVCPSEQYTTVREVLAAPPHDRNRRCTNQACRPCKRLDNVQRLSTMSNLEAQLPNDVYEFVDDEAPHEQSMRLVSRPLSRSRGASPPPADRDSPRYLDLMETGSQIIQIITQKGALGERVCLQAKLVRKTEAMNLNDVSLIEHENLFQQLVDVFERNRRRELQAEQLLLGIVGPPSSDGSVLASPAFATTSNTTAPFPKGQQRAKLLCPPVFRPTEADFTDPIAYFEQIMPEASKFGVVKVVAPASFKPSCSLRDDIRFTVSNQYLGRMYSRWTPAARELCAIKAYLASQGVHFTRPPLMNGLEVNLPKLYHIVQQHGGLKKVIQKKRWSRVAHEMRCTKAPNPAKKLDQVYVKYLLPYDTLSHQERQDLMCKVEKAWFVKHKRMLERALNPLHRQHRLLGESDSSDDEPEDDNQVGAALAEAEDCVVSGRSMNLATFKKVAASAMEVNYSGTSTEAEELEAEYWRLVLLGNDHVCVNAASIDTGEEGYGFPKKHSEPYASHPWNLKEISNNRGNVLRSLGPVLGVTVPTLHLGMVFSTSCWHRDPHGLPWIEYMHAGPGKIWYGVPNEESVKFRKAVESLCPTSRQNKKIWLPSDITMIPHRLLLEHNVSISRVEQQPGEFIIVFPKAYSSSVSLGYTESESVYFATATWLNSVQQIFQELRDSCEPTMFSLEQLLTAIARDERAPLRVLQQVYSNLRPLVFTELEQRRQLAAQGVALVDSQSRVRSTNRKRPAGAWNVREQDECEICRATLYLSKVVGLPEKKSSVCLQHALRLLALKRPEHEISCETFFSGEQLMAIISRLQSIIAP